MKADVDGTPVRELFVLLRHPAFMITMDSGTHECTRIYVFDGKARAGDRLDNRIGPGVIASVTFETGKGLRIRTSRGTIFSPVSDCQAVWTV